MAKVYISIPDGLLEEVDETAAYLHQSRSGLLQEAAAEYVAAAQERRAEAERRASIERAIASAREISERVEPFDSTAAIRADRDRDGRKIGEK